MRYRIGLDIGIASVGWAVINEDALRIEDLGVRLFKKAEEIDGKPLNLARRQARGTRKRLRRKAIRMKKVKKLLIKYYLISDEELQNLYVVTKKDKNVWQLRANGLDDMLDRKEWARVLTSIAKRRGYQSNRKEEGVGELRKNSIENKKILEEKSYRTIGEMFEKDEKFKNNKRNKKGENNNTTLRSMLIDEVHILFEAQRNFGNIFASKELEKEYIDIITYQKPYITPELLEKMLGRCTFEKQEHRAPKNSYTFERFMLLQKVNHLKINYNGEKIEISKKKKEEIINLAYEQTEIRYTQLRKRLALSKEARFEGLNYNDPKREELSEERIKQIEDKQFIKLEGWHKIRTELRKKGLEEKFDMIRKNPELQNIIADALVRNKTDESIRGYLQEKEIDEQIVNVALNINFTKFGHLSYKAMKKIIPALEKGLTYDKACKMAGYEFKGSTNTLQYKLPPVCNLEDKVLNPVVLRAVSQTRKVINAIIDKYGSPTSIYIETARELSKSFKERRAIEIKQRENEINNEKLKAYIKDNFHFEPKLYDIVKMKLWREQNGRCAYSQKVISEERLYEENYVQVDYIIPFSRCFNNTYQNKVLALASERQAKKEKTPFEYLGRNQQRWYSFEEFVNITYQFNPRKKENMLIKNFNEIKSKEWLERNLNDTKYISRFMYHYIANNLQFAQSELKRKIYNVNGQATSVLRYYWGLKKDREQSDKHHALDAAVIASATNKKVKKISDYSKKRLLYINNELIDSETGEIIEEKYNIDISVKEPWPKFREELEEKMKRVFVSRMPERKVTGKVHKDTMRSQKFIKQGEKFTVVKKPLQSISKQEIEEIVQNKAFEKLYLSDRIMYDDIYEKMKEANFNAKKAFAEEYRKYSKTGSGPIVRSIKVPLMGSVGVRLKNNSIAENCNMVRIDVFEKDSKHYLVPIYVSDFVKKQFPNKAIIGRKIEDEWLEMTPKYHFKFSLYPNDLVKVKKKNGQEVLGYYIGTDRSTASISLLEPDGSKRMRGIGVKNLEIFEKYQVDILGNIYKIKREKRIN